jgi:hypothetical protein
VLIDGNVFENNWADAQDGFCFVLKSENQQGDNPWTQTADVTIRYNRIRNTGSCFSFAGKYSDTDARVSVYSARITVHNNICEQVNVGVFTADGIATQALNGLTDLAMFHNTIRNGPSSYSNQALLFDGSPQVRFAYHSNALYAGQYGVFASGGSGSRALANFAPGALFANNVLVGGDCGTLPAGTMPRVRVADDARGRLRRGSDRRERRARGRGNSGRRRARRVERVSRRDAAAQAHRAVASDEPRGARAEHDGAGKRAGEAMSIQSRTGLLGAVLAMSALAPVAAQTYTPEAVGFGMPRSARGSGSRGRPNNKGVPDRATLKRRRKLALASKRRNRA